MSRAELAWRIATRSRIERQRLATLVRRPQWDRTALADALSPDAVDGALRQAVARGDWCQAESLLRARIRRRPARFFLDPSDAGALRQEILGRWPAAADEAAAQAERILAGTFDLLGYRGIVWPTSSGGALDWHVDPISGRRSPASFWADVPYLDPRSGDHKVTWELNRHQHWMALGRAAWLTGNERFARAVVDQLASWRAANPPLIGTNWTSMLELAFRSISWLWSLHVLLADERPVSSPADVWLVDMLIGLDRQLAQVASNLSYYFSPNTHLTGEALAQYVVGTALPELARSSEWIAVGRRVLLDEIDQQVGADGGHIERSTHYHRYTLDFYLLALRTAEIAGDAQAVAAFRGASARLAAFMRELADDRGRLPGIGDDDGGMLWPIVRRDPTDVRDSLSQAAILLAQPELAPWGISEQVFWTGGLRVRDAVGAAAAVAAVGDTWPAATPVRARVFPSTGLVVVRSDEGAHLVFDVGPHGFRNAGHAHADALAVTLSVGQQPLLIDPGTGTYTMDAALRNLLRGSTSHNTLTLDGRSSAVPSGPFQWASGADSSLATWRANGGLAWAEAFHDAYGSVRHRRSVVHGSGAGWVIVDQVLGDAEHRAELHWHLHPAWSADETERGLRLTSTGGRRAWLLHTAGGALVVTKGVWSPVYGALDTCRTVRLTQTVRAPWSVATWIGGGDEAAVLEKVAVDGDERGRSIAVRVRQGARAWTTMLWPWGVPEREERSRSVPEYHSNARLVQYGTVDGALTSLSLADGSHLLALRDGLLSLVAEPSIADLHVRLAGRVLALFASRPPSRLRLDGPSLRDISRIHLNGRELPRASSDGRSDVVTVHATDWALCAESPVLST